MLRVIGFLISQGVLAVSVAYVIPPLAMPSARPPQR